MDKFPLSNLPVAELAARIEFHLLLLLHLDECFGLGPHLLHALALLRDLGRLLLRLHQAFLAIFDVVQKLICRQTFDFILRQFSLFLATFLVFVKLRCQLLVRIGCSYVVVEVLILHALL
jgi:hypothetical protein